MSKFIFNPYIGAVCGSFMFLDLIKYIPRKEYNNPTIMSFVVLKTFTTGVIGSFVPITALFVGKEMCNKYKDILISHCS